MLSMFLLVAALPVLLGCAFAWKRGFVPDAVILLIGGPLGYLFLRASLPLYRQLDRLARDETGWFIFLELLYLLIAIPVTIGLVAWGAMLCAAAVRLLLHGGEPSPRPRSPLLDGDGATSISALYSVTAPNRVERPQRTRRPFEYRDTATLNAAGDPPPSVPMDFSVLEDYERHKHRTRWLDLGYTVLLMGLAAACVAWVVGGEGYRLARLYPTGGWNPSRGVPAGLLTLVFAPQVHSWLRSRRARRFFWG